MSDGGKNTEYAMGNGGKGPEYAMSDGERITQTARDMHGGAWMEQITYILGNARTLEAMAGECPWPVFAEETMDFLDQLSRRIRSSGKAKAYPELLSFGFWCRRQHLAREKDQYQTREPEAVRVGRGFSLHIVPSNIPLMFAYSMASALLAGNMAAVRLPARTSPQEQVLVELLEAAAKGTAWEARIVLIRYGHQKEITDRLSALCDLRILWGGNASLTELRKSPVQGGTVDLAFGDRRSAAVLDGAALLALEEGELQLLAQRFYGDTYLYDQNACASPALVYWQGSKDMVKAAQKRFWQAVGSVARERYELSGNTALQKWEKALKLAAACPGIRVEHQENYVLRIQLEDLTEHVWDHTMYGGFFLECSGESLEGLRPALGRRCQTLACFGLRPGVLARRIAAWGVKGVDRIVSVGRALDFELYWDGMDLIGMMSRRIYSCE